MSNDQVPKRVPVSDELAKLAEDAESVGQLRAEQPDDRKADGEKLRQIATDLRSIVEHSDRCEVVVIEARRPIGNAAELLHELQRLSEEVDHLIPKQHDDPHDPARHNGLKLERIRASLVDLIQKHRLPQFRFRRGDRVSSPRPGTVAAARRGKVEGDDVELVVIAYDSGGTQEVDARSVRRDFGD